MLTVDFVAPSLVDQVWPHIAEEMQKACEITGGDLSSGTLWQMCRSGNAFLMVVSDRKILMASVWRFETWPSGLVFRCMCLIGDRMDDWLEQAKEFAETKAKEGGAMRIITEGRKGWGRVFPQAKTLRQVYEVEL